MKYFYCSMPLLGFILIAQLLLPGCFQQPNYAPVIIGNNAPGKDNEKPVSEYKKPDYGKNEPIKEEPNLTVPAKKVMPLAREAHRKPQALGKYYVVKNGDTLYSIGVSSGHGYERLAEWNQISAPYQVETGEKLKLFKPVADSKMPSMSSYQLPVTGLDSEEPETPKLADAIKKDAEKNKLSDQQKPEISASKSSSKEEKKSVISTDNKKMLKLNFGWPIKGRISKNFKQSNNKGIDIAGKIGQKVHATEAGKIAFIGQGLIGFGNLIIIKHSDLYLSAYGNNSSLLVKEGEQVEKGQVIAEVGKALSKKAALHFEIRKNGKPVNPLIFLPKSDKAR